MTNENDVGKQNTLGEKEDAKNLRRAIIELIYREDIQIEPLLNYADRIYQYVMSGKPDSSQ